MGPQIEVGPENEVGPGNQVGAPNISIAELRLQNLDRPTPNSVTRLLFFDLISTSIGKRQF